MSNKTKISAIAVLGRETRAIGSDNDLIWKIPGDLPRLKKLTMGHPLIMGRKTYESIGRPLPGRKNIVVTRNSDFSADGVFIVNTKEEALSEARKDEVEEIFVFGGGQIYKMFMPETERLYLTLVDSDEQGDTFFPDYSDFKKVIEKAEAVSPDGLRTEFVVLER